MNKLAIVYWSGTGNTETMANCIAEGAKAAGAEVELMGPSEFSAARFSEFGVVAFGCPAMGSEGLEEAEFEPMFSDLERSLGGKRIALFGSYGWGGKLFDMIAQMLSGLKLDVIEPLQVKGKLKSDDYKKLDKIVEQIYEKHKLLGLV